MNTGRKRGGFPRKRDLQVGEQRGLLGEVPFHLGFQEEESSEEMERTQPKPHPDVLVIDWRTSSTQPALV